MTYKEAAIESALLYYAYLEKNGKGVIEYSVSEIKPSRNPFESHIFWLKLRGKPKNVDDLAIKIHNRIFTNDEIEPREYSSRTQQLKVSLKDSIERVLDHCTPEDVIVFSDLKFLVSRVGNWYKQFGDCIALPNGISTTSLPDCHMLTNIPSADQELAITSVLSEPFTYIWGAPGTGKTQLVLARAVLAHIQAGNRILVAAPTNNAVEQTLYGLLAVLEQANINYNKVVIRLGIPNAEFASRYPDICESAGYNKAISEIQDKLSSLRIALDDNRKARNLHNEYLSLQRRQFVFSQIAESLQAITASLSEIRMRYEAEKTVLDQLLARIKQNESDARECQNNQHFYSRQAQILLRQIRKPFHAFFSRSKRMEEQKSIDNFLEKARYYEEKLSALQATSSELNLQAAQQQNVITECQRSFYTYVSKACQCSVGCEELHSAANTISLETSIPWFHNIQSICKSLSQSYTDEYAKYTSVADRSISFFEQEDARLTKQIEQLESSKTEITPNDLEKRMETCQVIACTIDQCLHRFPVSRENHFAHVFLDEAGYASLIKSVALTAYSDNITFLGDHMQLPPVCEANEKELKSDENRLIALWAQSALFTETVFFKTPRELCHDYLSKTSIPFHYMKKYNLVNSFRFGEALAQVLADDVYDSRFHGNDDHCTKIFFIDAPKRAEPVKRISNSECEAIEAILRNSYGLHTSSGIITPYKNQVGILKRMASRINFPPENILTVHRSQGREWDTIFLSVTDTTDKFFTNSLSSVSEGKKIINTAVSRARKNLVIVCDYQYWITQTSQLIGKLLAVAEELVDVNQLA